MLPRATLTVDPFHVVQLAAKAVGDVRRRVVRARYGRRGRSGDPEYDIKHLLVRNLEHLSPDQFAKIIDTLDRDRYGQEIAAAWIGKEKLRDALNLRARVTGSAPCERAVQDRLLAFYDWCAQHDDIPAMDWLDLEKVLAIWNHVAEGREPEQRIGHSQAVDHFVHDNVIADQQRAFHRTRGNLVRLEQKRAQHDGQRKRYEECLGIFAEDRLAGRRNFDRRRRHLAHR